MARAGQACEACRRRKVRCNGEAACQQCVHLNLKCHYSPAAPLPRTRKNISRGGIIDAYKRESRSTQETPAPRLAPRGAASVPQSNSQAQQPAFFDPAFFAALVADYSTDVFPVLPIISGSEFTSAIYTPNISEDGRAFVYALAAVTINMTRVGPRHAPDNQTRVLSLCTGALELRDKVLPDTPITTRSAMIPLLISTCPFDNRRNTDMAIYYLHEAITRAQIIQNNESGRLDALSAGERAQFSRLLWLLFMHERFLAITHNRSTSLPIPPSLLEPEDTIEARAIAGFFQLIRLFRVIDVDFIGHWLDRQRSSLTIAWIEQKQLELGNDMDLWESEIAPLTDMQQIDLMVTRCWLHTLLWQMALSKFLLTSTPEGGKDFMSILFPIRLSHRLRSILAVMPRKAVEIHGTGIVQKLFDITNTIADVLAHVPAATSDDTVERDHLDDFLFLYRFLLTMSEFYTIKQTVLVAKLSTLQSRFQSLRHRHSQPVGACLERESTYNF